MQTKNSIIALDVGEKRIGVAVANSYAGFPRQLRTVVNDDSIWDVLRQIISQEQADTVVIGLPRNLDGDSTAQTSFVESFANELKKRIDSSIVFQDEALTSVKAEEELRLRKKTYTKADVDALAATYILEDYINSQRNI
jgi:putative holliday junction resolvase